MRRTGRDIARAAFVIGLLSTWPAAAQQWPQFRGPGASGVAVDDPRLPDTWSATDNVAWSVAIPGRGWSSPVVWGDHVLVVSAVNTRQVETLNPVPSYLARSLGGPMSGAAITQATDEYRWMLYDVDVQTGRIRWERVIKAAVPDQAVHQKNSFASETPVTDGERVLRVPRLRRALRLRHDGTASLGEAHGRAEDAHRLGHGGLAGPPRRPPLHRQRQRRPVVHRRLRRANRRRTVANGTPGRSVELVFAVHLADRPADRDRDDGEQEGAIVRHQRRAAVGARGHDVDSCGDARLRATACSSSARAIFRTRCVRPTRSGRVPGATSRSNRGRRATSSSRGRTRPSRRRTPRRLSSAISTTR